MKRKVEYFVIENQSLDKQHHNFYHNIKLVSDRTMETFEKNLTTFILI